MKPIRTRDEVRIAVQELRSRGLRILDISNALGIAESEIARLITEPSMAAPSPVQQEASSAY